MPSKNSINKPKVHMIRTRKATSLRRKKALKSSKFVTTNIRNSKGENSLVQLKSGGGTLANIVLSNKKAKKLKRNQKYALQRSGKKVDQKALGAAAEEEDVVRAALWRVAEEGVVSTAVAFGEGTTLGL